MQKYGFRIFTLGNQKIHFTFHPRPKVTVKLTASSTAAPNPNLLFSSPPMDSGERTVLTAAATDLSPPPPPLTKSAMKKQMKQKRQEERKAQRKTAEKERRKQELERKRKEWDEKLASLSEDERVRLVEARKEARKERMGKRAEERGLRMERLQAAKVVGQKIVVDLEFADLMTSNEIHSLVQQIMYCYAVNGRCETPAHLWLTGCRGEINTQLQRLPGYDKWMIEKESRSYLEALQDRKEDLVYLTADANEVLDELDPKSVYIVGGLVDRNRWKGITLKKAQEQEIRSARLPIGSFLKMSSSQVLTVNQVVEILLKFFETKDWKSAFFQVIPLRKRFGDDNDNDEQNQATNESDIKHVDLEEENEDTLNKENKERHENVDDEEDETRDCKKKKIEDNAEH